MEEVREESFFPIVGVGASAGGLEAFKELVAAIPPDSGIAFILVQHLAPDHHSVLAEILRKSTTLPVIEIRNGVQIAPDHIYVIPSNTLLTISEKLLVLDPLKKSDRINTIDVFFTSLAENHQQHCFGILLSGSGSDGTVGLKTIKDQGGTTMVQNESSATHFAMAKSALNADVVDFVLSPAQMPARILQIINASDLISVNPTKTEKNERDTFNQILALVKAKRGADFTYYKQSTIQRRILRRKSLTGKDSLSSYADFLFENKTEQDALYKDILIPVTAFFRDSTSFSLLTKAIFPVLFKDKLPADSIRIWVAGCSTGEEAYSIAICLQEYFNDPASAANVQIFATDISEISIVKARSGIYKKQDLAGVSEERLNKFFIKSDGNYQVNKFVREMCLFATQNFLQDPPFGKLDMISSRNVLIYLETYLQKRALTTFHYALNNNGILFLGRSESVGTLSRQFALVNNHDRFYRRNAGVGKFVPAITGRDQKWEKPSIERTPHSEIRKDDFQKAADNALLEKMAAVGVLVNDQMDVVQFRGSTREFLESPAGDATHNILKMAREGLSFELRNALLKAKETKVQVRKHSISIEKGKRRADIEVIPLKNTIEAYYLVLFTESESDEPAISSGPKNETADEKDSRDIQQERFNDLELNLAHAREDMRAITEDQEAANEELQSANEELLSGSEELQTLNEELETSKEEIQSSNEELTILNQELIDRNEQLIHSRKYAEAIVSTLHEAIIILSGDFRVKSANKCFYETFGLNDRETEGCPFFECNNGIFNIPHLRSSLENVLPYKTHFEALPIRIILEKTEKEYELNARQIVNESSNEQLILLALQDVTEKKLLQNAQEVFAGQMESKIKEQTRELIELNTGLKSSNETLKQFNSIASHDLQEPLRKIKTFAIMLNRSFGETTPEGSRTLMDKITASVERMSRLIRDVLELSKLDRGELRFIPTNLDLVLKNVLTDLDLLISETEASIGFENLLPTIEAIPVQMHQLFYNLLNNALKFRKPGITPAITISCTIVNPGSDAGNRVNPGDAAFVKILVRDNGIGFEQQFADQIFNLFERLHGANEYNGTGVGLALCKKVVENHGGELYAASEEEKGASFFIHLPLVQRNQT